MWSYEQEYSRAEFETRWIEDEAYRLIEEYGYDEDEAFIIAEERYQDKVESGYFEGE